jgi:putative transposase
MGKANAMLVPHAQYARLGRRDAERRQAYRALFRAHLDETIVDEIRSATNGHYALGNRRFQQQIEAALGRRAIRGEPGRPAKALREDYRQQALL